MTAGATGGGRRLITSESVTEGHPDKVCDQVSDAILDWCLERDPMARVACETSAKSTEDRDWIAVYGETTPLVPREEADRIVRDILRDIGYTDRAYGTCADTVEVDVLLSGQSGDIAMGVDTALEAKQGDEGADDADTGAGDQGMMFGFACDETPELMPMSIVLAHKLTRRLTDVRKDGTLPWLRPDGKSQVTIAYEGSQVAHVDAVVVSAQHDPDVEQGELEQLIRRHVIEPVLADMPFDDATKCHINPTGRFVVGGPLGDAGLTGRKIIADSYGGVARHGGGAFSGKDPTKVDRSGAYACRWVAKNVVAAGLAKRCEVAVAYAIGVARPVSIEIETFGTETVSPAAIAKAVAETFDLRPASIIRSLDLRRPIFRQTAAYGHFGRDDLSLPWEATDDATRLRKAVGSAA